MVAKTRSRTKRVTRKQTHVITKAPKLRLALQRDLDAAANSIRSVAINHLMANNHDWREWNKLQPVGAVFVFPDEQILATEDPKALQLMNIYYLLKSIL